MSLATEPVLNEETKLLLPENPSLPTSRKCSVASVSRTVPHVKSADDWARRDKATPWIWYNDLFFVGPIVLAVSLLVGILFYMWYNKWTFGSATFCATATLIGSIYGVPNQPDNVGAAFTILYYVYGISLFTAIIGAIIGSMITRAPLISAEARRKIAQMEQPEDTDGDGEIGYYDYFFFLHVRFLDQIGWEEYRLNYLVTSAALSWVVLGVLYGVYVEGWDVNHSLYFAMNAVSMAALADPPCENGDSSHCDVGFYRGIAMSVYLLLGVPLFTLALAQLAGLVINRAVRENEYKIIHQPLTQDEYNYAANLYGNDEVLSLGEFTVLELLRLQRVSMEDLEHIKNLFCAIDEAATGMVDQPMLAKRNLIHQPENQQQPQPGGRGRERSASNASSSRAQQLSARRTRSRSRSQSLGSYNGARRRDSPPSMKIPSVIFDEGEGTSAERNSEGPGGAWVGEEGDNDSDSGGHSSIAAPEIPASIKRMTIGEYNELVVPLAFTTLIENFEEEGGAQEPLPSEDGDAANQTRDEEEGEASSYGFNTAAEEEEDWPSDSGYRYGGIDGFRASSGGSAYKSRLPPVDSGCEGEEEDEDDAEVAAIAAQRTRSRSSTVRRGKLRKTVSRKSRTPTVSSRRPSRLGGLFAATSSREEKSKDGGMLSDLEKGYKSET